MGVWKCMWKTVGISGGKLWISEMQEARSELIPSYLFLVHTLLLSVIFGHYLVFKVESWANEQICMHVHYKS